MHKNWRLLTNCVLSLFGASQKLKIHVCLLIDNENKLVSARECLQLSQKKTSKTGARSLFTVFLTRKKEFVAKCFQLIPCTCAQWLGGSAVGATRSSCHGLSTFFNPCLWTSCWRRGGLTIRALERSDLSQTNYLTRHNLWVVSCHLTFVRLDWLDRCRAFKTIAFKTTLIRG